MSDWAEIYVSILNVYSKYNLASDFGDAESFASCFTKEGRLAHTGREWVGTDAIRAFKEQEYATRTNRTRRHWNDNINLTRQSDGSVLCRAYMRAFEGAPDEAIHLTHQGVYQDTLIQEDGEWKFAERLLTLDDAPVTSK